MGAGLFVWFVVGLSLGTPESLVAVLLPVWAGGLAGGVVCALFSLRQAVTMAFVCSVLLALGLLWFRHGYLGLALGDNTFVGLWPFWFVPAYYVGAYGYIGLRKLGK